MRSILLSAAAVAAVLFLDATPAWSITFNDGQVHVIDAGNSYPFEQVIVGDGPNGATTTLEIVPGSQIGTDGVDGGLEALGGSMVIMSGGTILGGNILLRNTAMFNLSGGLMGSVGALAAFDESVLNASGGETRNQLIGHDHARMMVTGGRFGAGSGTSLVANEFSFASLAGGEFPGELQIRDNSEAIISGGTLGGPLLALQNSMATIIGSDFNLPFGEVAIPQGTLTGMLADGSSLSITFQRASTATITLVCPGVGFLSPTTSVLAASQNNYCENWTGVSQPADDLSGAGLKLVNLAGANLSAALLIDADLTDADLSGADLILADLSGAILTGALYDESTFFPSGNTVDSPPWGLPGGASPWGLGMKPVPESGSELMIALGALGLVGLAAMKGSSSCSL